jgi:iron-sulfur cluster repair protein YtfE (RIC family)
MADDTLGTGDAGPPRGRFTIVYLIHEAFRRDLARLSSAVRTPGASPARAAELRNHWTFVEEQLHHHHQVEDDSLWPLVRPKLSGRPQELAVLQEMEAQHHTLEPITTSITTSFATYATAPDPERGSALADEIDTLRDQLGSHLDDEETRCFPVVDDALNKEEFESFGKATAKAVGMKGSAKFFPWIFDGADPVERAAVLSMPPPPVRILSRYVWEPRYDRRAARLWVS